MRWALIDVSYLAHRACWAIKGLEHDGEPTAVIFGFFEQLYSVCTDPKVRTSNIALFFDSQKSLRRDIYPAYKSGRGAGRTDEQQKQADDMRHQVKLMLRRIAPDIGMPVFLLAGYESDDLMAAAAADCGAGDSAVIVTADSDLWQCLRPGICWYDPGRKLLLDETSLAINKGFTPLQWREIKCITGCQTDNVKGIPGVGDKTAYGWVVHGKGGARAAAIASPQGETIRAANRELISLPFKGCPAIKLRKPEYNTVKFFHWCEKLGMKRWLENRRRWEEFFAGRIAGAGEAKQSPRKPRPRGLMDV